MTKYEKYTREILEDAVAKSMSFAGVLRVLQMKQAGGSQSHIANRIRQFEIDTSHFTGQAHNRGGTTWNRRTMENVLVLGNPTDRRTKRVLLLRAMLESGFEYLCAGCGIGPVWNNKPLTLEIDHINGDFWDNRAINLQFMCPNCHSQELDTSKPRKYR